MMSGFAAALSGLPDLGYWDGGNVLSDSVGQWFAENMVDQSATVNEMLNNEDAWEGLDWLLAAGGFWGDEFADKHGGSQWLMFDMIDGVRNGGAWNLFGQNADGTYTNATNEWFNKWIAEQ